jgi:hypothetical protein
VLYAWVAVTDQQGKKRIETSEPMRVFGPLNSHGKDLVGVPLNLYTLIAYIQPNGHRRVLSLHQNHRLSMLFAYSKSAQTDLNREQMRQLGKAMEQELQNG